MTNARVKRTVPRRWGLIAAIAGALMLVSTALAVHDDQFQLEGNTVVDPSPPDTLPGGGPNPFANTDFDWESLFTDPNVATTGPGNRPTEVATLPTNFKDVEFIEDWSLVNGTYQTSDPTTFTQSKDIDNVNAWRCKAANQVTNKGDITNAYAAVYDNGTKRILYFGLEKDQDSGSNNVGIWLLQSSVSCPGGGTGNGNAFSGTHVPGDIFMVSEFTNGGGVSTIRGYEWKADINPSRPAPSPASTRIRSWSAATARCRPVNRASTTGCARPRTGRRSPRRGPTGRSRTASTTACVRRPSSRVASASASSRSSRTSASAAS